MEELYGKRIFVCGAREAELEKRAFYCSRLSNEI